MSERADMLAAPSGGVFREAELFLPLALPGALWRLAGFVLALALGLVAMRGNHADQVQFALAVVLVGPLWLLGGLMATAVTPLAAQAFDGSMTDRQRVGGLWRQALLLALLPGLAGAVLSVVAPLLPPPPGVFDANHAGRLASSLLLAMLPGMLALACASVLRASGQGGVVVLAALLASVLALAMVHWLTDLRGTDSPLPLLPAIGRAALVAATVAAALLLVAVWWMPRRDTLGLPAGFSRDDWAGAGELHARARSALRDAGPVMALGVAAVAIAGALGAPALATVVALGLVLTPGALVGWALASAGARRVAAVRRTSQTKPGALGRCGSRCTVLTLLPMLLVALLYEASPKEVLPLVLGPMVLQSPMVALLPLGVAVLVFETMAALFTGGLASLDAAAPVAKLQWAVVGGTLVLAAVAALPLGFGPVALLAVLAAGALLRTLLMAHAFRTAAEASDSAAAEAVRRRSEAIAKGWADTVVLSPSSPGARRRRRAARP